MCDMDPTPDTYSVAFLKARERCSRAEKILQDLKMISLENVYIGEMLIVNRMDIKLNPNAYGSWLPEAVFITEGELEEFKKTAEAILKRKHENKNWQRY